MKTLQKDGRTLTKEKIYLDLSKLSEEEISRTRKTLYENREYVPFFTNLFDIERYYKLHFDNGDWLCGVQKIIHQMENEFNLGFVWDKSLDE